MPTPDAARLLTWISASRDNAGQVFVIVDKRKAQVMAFDADGNWRGAAPALLGQALGDRNPAGIGDRPLAAIGPGDRVTAAGRYVARLGNDLGKADILWVDYASALSLHRVIKGKPSDQRLRRLASPSVADNRISFGCINVPAAYFDGIVRPMFLGTTGIVYILPETQPLEAVFAMAGPTRQARTD